MTGSLNFAFPALILTFAEVGVNKHSGNVCTRNVTLIDSKSQPLVDALDFLLYQRVGCLVIFQNSYSIFLEVCHQLVAVFTLNILVFLQISLCLADLIGKLLVNLNTGVNNSLVYINGIKGICQAVQVCSIAKHANLLLHSLYCSGISYCTFYLCSIEVGNLIDYIGKRLCVGCHILAGSINDGTVSGISNGVLINIQILIEQGVAELLAVQQVGELTIGNFLFVDTVNVMSVFVNGTAIQGVAVGNCSRTITSEILMGIGGFCTCYNTDSVAVLNLAVATQPS